MIVLAAGMNGEEVGDVAVPGLGFLVGTRSFHQAAVGADLGRCEIVLGGADFG